MAIVSGDLKEYKSNSANSDGGDITATEVVDNTDNNLFSDITGDEAAAGGTEYRKAFRKNTHGTLDWQNVVTWLQSQPTNAALSFGFGINHADDADGAQGNMSAFSANAVVAVVSDGADTRQITIVGEDASGNRQQEILTLNGTTEVVGALTFSKLYGAYAASLSGSRIVTIRQGSGGTTRGTIGVNKKISFIWYGRRYSGGSPVDAEGGNMASKAAGMEHGNIAAGANFGIWYRLTWPAGAGAVTANSSQVKSEGDTAA
jgi:hypothetical protein